MIFASPLLHVAVERGVKLERKNDSLRRAFDGQGVRWVRMDAWDVASNGAITRPKRIAP